MIRIFQGPFPPISNDRGIHPADDTGANHSPFRNRNRNNVC